MIEILSKLTSLKELWDIVKTIPRAKALDYDQIPNPKNSISLLFSILKTFELILLIHLENIFQTTDRAACLPGKLLNYIVVSQISR